MNVWKMQIHVVGGEVVYYLPVYRFTGLQPDIFTMYILSMIIEYKYKCSLRSSDERRYFHVNLCLYKTNRHDNAD